MFVVDDVDEVLIIMDIFEEDSLFLKYIEDIIIFLVFIERNFGDILKKVIRNGDMVNVNFDWREVVFYSDDRVEYELWIISNDECGVKCEMLMGYMKEFKGVV